MPEEAPQSNPQRIPYARQSIDDSDREAVAAALRSDFITQGPRNGYFEDALKEATGARYAVAVSSGTAALHLAYLGLGMGDGDVGISPAITFAATANALRYCGSEVDFCDVDPQSGLARVADFRERVDALAIAGQKAKLFAPVSFTGRMPRLREISEYAAQCGAYVVEDAAHSIGAHCDSTKSASCTHSDAAVLSFHPVKHVCAGEGGAVLTNDETLARRARNLRSHGIERPLEAMDKEGAWFYAQTELGWNYRMTEMQAALGNSQLERLDGFVARRRAIAQRYDEAFRSPIFRNGFERPEMTRGSSWHLYVIRFPSSNLRREAYDFFQANGIGVQVHYIPVYRHPYYRKVGFDALPGSEAFYEGCLSLPLFPALSDDEQQRVVDTAERFCRSIDI